MPETNPKWPVLTAYDQDHLARIALPLGGIGTGTVSLGGRGDLRDWEIVNRPARGFAPQFTFFAISAKQAGGTSVTRVLEGPIEPPYDSQNGFRGTTAGLPRFRQASFHAAYPLGQVLLDDPDVPVSVRIEAFNPFVPVDADTSGMPFAAIRFVLTNTTAKPVTAAIAGSLQNFIGTDGSGGKPCGNRNVFRRSRGVRGLYMESTGVSRDDERWGTMALATPAKTGVSVRAAWQPNVAFFEQMLDFWDDFSLDGAVDERVADSADAPVGSLAIRKIVPPGATRHITFLLCWHFPNRMTWTPSGESCCASANRIGNYYATRYRDAWRVAEIAARRLPHLERDTAGFVRAFCESDLPDVVKEAALNNLSTLRSQTCFRTEDGRFFGWEGACDGSGCCHGSCTHVWNYEQATAHLFGELALSMRDTEFAHATREDGFMSFRVNLPIERASEMGTAAADGQMGCITKLYRDWQLSGDDAMLRRLWPKAQKALEFAWIRGGWDADRDGVMEGCQHNTTDLEFYGPNPLMAGWYLGALRAAEEMSRYLGDKEFATECRHLFECGRAWVDANLFNGEYYEQEIRPPARRADIAPGLCSRAFMANEDPTAPPQQVGAGCMTDQLVGQYMANVCGLGKLFDEDHVRQTLASIMRHNFVPTQFGHVNILRAFTINDEAMLAYGSYPHGGRPERPCFRFFENWTGVEYAAAILMMQEGMIDHGLRVIRAIRDRFDGRKRNPFDEPECGHHYARAMASWAAVLALTGFRYSGVTGTIRFVATDDESRLFWSTGHAWGTFEQKPDGDGTVVVLRVLGGRLKVKCIEVAGRGCHRLGRRRYLCAGRRLAARIA